MFERFTNDARHVVVVAGTEADRLGDNYVGDEHILLALCGPRSGAAGAILARCGVTAEAVEQALAAARRGQRPRDPEGAGSGDDDGDRDGDEHDAAVLKTIGIDLDEIRRRTEATFGPGAWGHGALERGDLGRGRVRTGHIMFTKQAKRALARAARESVRQRSPGIATEHILLGVLAQDGSAAVATVQAMRISPTAIQRQVLAGLGQKAG